jgi:glycolate oxidase FAD binding subunit
MAAGIPVRDALDSALVALGAAGVDTPRLDAEVLLADVLGVTRADLLVRDLAIEGEAIRRFQDAVRRRAVEAASLMGGEVTDEPAWWGRLPVGEVTAKATSTLVGVRGLLAAARAAEDEHGGAVALRGSAAGVLFAGITPPTADAAAGVVARLRGAAPRPGDGTVTVLVAPPAVRSVVDVWGPVGGLDLMRRVKHRLDPGRHLAPGRFVGGI